MQREGKPGPILGFSPLADGHNTEVAVEIDTSGATETPYARLHTHAGQIGTCQFPDGPHAPVKVRHAVITPPFNVSGGRRAALPETGGQTPPWANILLDIGGLALLSGLGLTLARRAR